MKTVHSILALLVLISLIMVIINAAVKRQKKFKPKDRKIGLIALILTHSQLLIGTITFLISPFYEALKNGQIKKIMKVQGLRLIIIEHPLTMIIAVILVTIGWSRHKKSASDSKKFNSFLLFYGIALLFILIRIPWKQWSLLFI